MTVLTAVSHAPIQIYPFPCSHQSHVLSYPLVPQALECSQREAPVCNVFYLVSDNRYLNLKAWVVESLIS